MAGRGGDYWSINSANPPRISLKDGNLRSAAGGRQPSRYPHLGEHRSLV